MRYTEEQKDWIRSNYKDISTRDLTDKFNAKFSMNLPWKKLRYFKHNNHLNSGHITQFDKEFIPWNKGTKGLSKSNKTSFKKGNRPANYKPLGSTRIDSKDGYLLIKVGEPRKWMSYQRYIYEKYHHVKLKSNETIRFLDRNKLNFSRDNLVKVTQSESAVINKSGKIFDDPDLNKTMINVARLKIITSRREKE